MSDPNNQHIERVANAGDVIDGNVVMHNGLLVPQDCYYGNFSEILQLNKGVHEPTEEYIFSKILKAIPENGTMVELGSYWAFYSMWFYREIKNANVYCVEPNESYLQAGIDNCKLNNVQADFTLGSIGIWFIRMKDFVESKKIKHIDILHADIQSCELEMLCTAKDLLASKRISYLFISTHTNKLHYACIEYLKSYNYNIIFEIDMDKTYCHDGILVAKA